MLSIEIWKNIKDLPYEISSLGRVRNLKGKILKTYIQNSGYDAALARDECIKINDLPLPLNFN